MVLSEAQAGLGPGAEIVQPEAELQGTRAIQVVDIYSESGFSSARQGANLALASTQEDLKMYQGDAFVSSSLVRQGVIPCAPFEPTVGITVRVLELFRIAHLHCPHLAIQPYVKTLCDLRDVPFRGYLTEQFSVCFDLYLSIRRGVDRLVKTHLNRAGPNWRLENACPPCACKLVGEPALKFSILATMDGNESLKRRDPRHGATDDDPNPCAERWKNMLHELTSKMFGVYDESGAFISVCRHGFILVVTDMVKSGEL